MQPHQITAALNVAVNAARTAGTFASQKMSQLDKIKVREKKAFDFVSEIDILSENIIKEQLSEAYPDFGILAEESGHTNPDSDSCWIVDPIDGTSNYIRGNPHFAVSIALRHQEDVVAGVVYDPLRNELFTARKGSGAQLDGRRIRVSDTNRLAKSTIATGIAPHNKQFGQRWLRCFAALLPRVQNIHKNGSTVLDLAWLACGRYDGCLTFAFREWDIAAGSLLVQEAGGLISDITQAPSLIESQGFVAGTPKVHEKMMYLLSKI